MIPCISLVSIAISFSFLILLIWFLSFFAWWIRLKFYQFNFVFLEEPTFSYISLIFSLVFFVSIYFCSDLLISFLFANFGFFVCSTISSSFRCKVRVKIFIVSWDKIMLLLTSSWITSAASHRLCLHLHLPLSIF